MRYLLHESQIQELSGRRDYLYDIFHLFFLPGTPEGGFVPLCPMGCDGPDILFIIGHADFVKEYLKDNMKHISEKIIVATTCLPNNLKRYCANKEIYVPNISDGYCYIHKGKPYGFDFDPTDAELDMYNASGDIIMRIQAGYRLLK